MLIVCAVHGLDQILDNHNLLELFIAIGYIETVTVDS